MVSDVNGNGESAAGPTILYCHCAYAKVIPTDVRDEVLKGLTESGVAFEAVPDLCEMAARKDPALQRIAGCGELKIAACFPRAVTWLFHGAGTPLPENQVEILNMRTRAADEIVLAGEVQHHMEVRVRRGPLDREGDRRLGGQNRGSVRTRDGSG